MNDIECTKVRLADCSIAHFARTNNALIEECLPEVLMPDVSWLDVLVLHCVGSDHVVLLRGTLVSRGDTLALVSYCDDLQRLDAFLQMESTF